MKDNIIKGIVFGVIALLVLTLIGITLYQTYSLSTIKVTKCVCGGENNIQCPSHFECIIEEGFECGVCKGTGGGSSSSGGQS